MQINNPVSLACWWTCGSYTRVLEDLLEILVTRSPKTARKKRRIAGIRDENISDLGPASSLFKHL